ncbi:MAG: hypothetical protein R3F28_05885 [Candidatus Kapaibacterium sp.]
MLAWNSVKSRSCHPVAIAGGNHGWVLDSKDSRNLVLLKDPAVIITGGYSATNVNRSGFVEAFDNDQNVVKVAEMKVNGQYEFGGRFVFIDTHLDFLNKHARALRRVDDDFIWRVRIGYQSPISKIGSSR